jgi:hypothetical protein
MLLAAACWLFGPWIARGELTLAALVIPQIVLCINLLAAGALVFPAVITTLLVLAPVAVLFAGHSDHAEESDAVQRRRRLGHLELSSLAAGIVALVSVMLALACLYTEYYPVLNGRSALANALYRLDERRIAFGPIRGGCSASCGWLSGRPRGGPRTGRDSSRRPTRFASSIRGIIWPGTPAEPGF